MSNPFLKQFIDEEVAKLDRFGWVRKPHYPPQFEKSNEGGMVKLADVEALLERVRTYVEPSKN